MDGRVKNDQGIGLGVDWPEIGIELRRLGWSATMIARAINLPRETVRSWFELGCEPRWSSGESLLRLRGRIFRGEEPKALNRRKKTTNRIYSADGIR